MSPPKDTMTAVDLAIALSISSFYATWSIVEVSLDSHFLASNEGSTIIKICAWKAGYHLFGLINIGLLPTAPVGVFGVLKEGAWQLFTRSASATRHAVDLLQMGKSFCLLSVLTICFGILGAREAALVEAAAKGGEGLDGKLEEVVYLHQVVCAFNVTLFFLNIVKYNTAVGGSEEGRSKKKASTQKKTE